MPHITLEYSQNLGPELDMPQLVTDLQDKLVELGIDRVRVKSRAIPVPHSVVGENPVNEGFMLHLTLELLEGRDIPTRQTYGQALHALLESAAADIEGCSVTVNVREMVKGTYIQ